MTEAFGDCLHVACENCGAKPNVYCTNVLGDGQRVQRRSPCNERMLAAGRATA